MHLLFGDERGIPGGGDEALSLRTAAAVYSLLMGVAMLGMWGMFYLTGNIPELMTKPVEIALHLVAEAVTAVLLVVGGIGLLRRAKWTLPVYYLSMGMLLYTLLMSPGYFLQRGEYAFGWMFGVFLVLALSLVLLSVLRRGDFINRS